jgi:hypothetical protein
MSLHAVGEDDAVTNIPHQAQFQAWKNRLSAAERQAINDRLGQNIDGKIANGEGVVTSSWLPKELCPSGDNWDGTPFQVIYDKACGASWMATGQCFGLFVWEHMMNRPEKWHFMKCELDGVPIAGTTYFRCQQQHQ